MTLITLPNTPGAYKSKGITWDPGEVDKERHEIVYAPNLVCKKHA